MEDRKIVPFRRVSHESTLIRITFSPTGKKKWWDWHCQIKQKYPLTCNVTTCMPLCHRYLYLPLSSDTCVKRLKTWRDYAAAFEYLIWCDHAASFMTAKITSFTTAKQHWRLQKVDPTLTITKNTHHKVTNLHSTNHDSWITLVSQSHCFQFLQGSYKVQHVQSQFFPSPLAISFWAHMINTTHFLQGFN